MRRNSWALAFHTFFCGAVPPSCQASRTPLSECSHIPKSNLRRAINKQSYFEKCGSLTVDGDQTSKRELHKIFLHRVLRFQVQHFALRFTLRSSVRSTANPSSPAVPFRWKWNLTEVLSHDEASSALKKKLPPNFAAWTPGCSWRASIAPAAWTSSGLRAPHKRRMGRRAQWHLS